MKRLFSTLFAAAAVCLLTAVSHAEPLELKKGDRICLIGGALAERMQHDGWLETLIQARFPQHELAFRNLGFSGDELTTRLRSAGFGSPDEWLTRCKADVIFAFFGYNESFAGEAGLEQFKKDLTGFINHISSRKYNGESPPRLVLISPIAFEGSRTPHLPDGREHNRRLKLYSSAMQEAAKAHQVPFVDLFNATKLYGRPEPFTINGAHLTEFGNRSVAEIIVKRLFPTRSRAQRGNERRIETERLTKLRAAVRDKNFYWFHRYRTVDGYNVYGGRSHLKYTQGKPGRGYDEGLSNRVVMQREMEVLDGMTANRDKRIWSVARSLREPKSDSRSESSKLPPVDDSNTPPFIPVETNKPGPLPGGRHDYLGGEEAIEQMSVAAGMKVALFADEKMFPELINPVQMAFDTKGRLWVATWPTYPHWKPKKPMDDRLLILEDTDGDGRADRCKTFAGGLHCPTGFEFWGGGVLVAQAPDLMFLKDTDADDTADVRTRILHGLDSADTHHTANSFVIGPGGALYFQEGVFHQSQIETIHQGPLRNNNACVWRFNPRTWHVSRYIPFDFANPHGHVFDRWGQDIVHDGTGAQPYHATLFSGHLDYPAKHPKPPQVYQQKTRPCPATEILSSRHFPDELQGNLLVGNVIGFQGILQYRLHEKGASFGATEVEPIVRSSDPNFRPVDLEIAPDGSLYFTDWQNPVIGHMQHHIRDPSRDKTHGRVYRVTYPSRPLLKPKKIAGEPIEKLLDLLQEPDSRVRYRARIELSGCDGKEVIAAAREWVARLDKDDPDYEHHLLEALWLHQSHNAIDADLLKRVLGSPDFRARAAATRVLCYQRDRVPGSLELLKKLAADEHPRVRLEAVRAASFYKVPEAVEVVVIASEQPTDQYLEYTKGETMKAIEVYWKAALADQPAVGAHRGVNFTTDAGLRFLLKNVSTPRLLKMKRTRGVYLEMLYREGLREEHRQEALAGLARLDDKPQITVLLEAIENIDERQRSTGVPDAAGTRLASPGVSSSTVVYDLVRLLTSRNPAELAKYRRDLEKMATGGRLPVVRQIGYVALITADGGVAPAWRLAVRSVRSLRDLLQAMPLIPDPSVRADLYPKVEPLLAGLPKSLSIPDAGSGRDGVHGRYVRIELPGIRRTLTLAEVEVYGRGVNIARRGKARQSSTAHGGEASRAIDGNTSGDYGSGGQTHTRERSSSPWWEVDLGREYPIDSIVVHNRTDGNLGQRLDGFTLQVLDADRNPVYQKRDIPAPSRKAAFEVGGSSPESLIRRAAMNALTYVRGKETQTFQTLAEYVKKDIDRLAAVRAMQRIPREYWPKENNQPLLAALLAWVRKLPAEERTTPAALDAFELASSLAATLPAAEAKKFRAELGVLGVRVIRLGTLPHRMAYNKERLAVQAGRTVEIAFENTDIMPHNFVIVEPGSLEDVGMLAEATGNQPDAAERQYVPESNKVMLASRLLFPQQAQKLTFTAPNEPGVYPYVCTYPGHWRRMYGALYVVADLDQYLADPQAYLAANELPIRDPLLEFNRPRKEWTLEELLPLVKAEIGGEAGRSHGNGRQMFRVANCVACHKLNGDGREFGPDLAQLDQKEFGPEEVLGELIDPSARINEKFYSYTFVLESGKIVTGLVVEETPKVIKVVEDPLAKADPVEIDPSDVARRVKSKTSIMPKGLLDRLTREEILDLIAYVAARGARKHPYFHGRHHHGPNHPPDR